MKNILYRILRYFAKEYLKMYEEKKLEIIGNEKKPKAERIDASNNAFTADNMIGLIKIEEAWEVYKKEIKKINP